MQTPQLSKWLLSIPIWEPSVICQANAPLKHIANRLDEKYYNRRVKVKTSATISSKFSSNLYTDGNNFECAKWIRKAGSSDYVCQVYMQPDDLSSLQSKQNKNSNKKASKQGSRAMLLKCTRPNLVIQKLEHTIDASQRNFLYHKCDQCGNCI